LWFYGFDRSGDNILRGIAARNPRADELAASVFGTQTNLFEAGLAQHGFEFVHIRGAGDASAMSGQVGRESGRQIGGADDIGDREASAGFEDAEGFAEHPGFIGREIDNAVGDDDVDGAVSDGEIFDLTEAKLDIGRSDVDGIGYGFGEHGNGHIDAENAAGGTDGAGSEKAIETGAAAEIENRFAGLKSGDGLGVAATETEIGALGQRSNFFVGIAQFIVGSG